MTEDEKGTMKWLERVVDNGGDVVMDRKDAKTLLRLLARPTLPEEPTTAAIEAMVLGVRSVTGCYAFDGTMEIAYRALYAHLSKPKTKTTWNVSWKHDRDSGSNGGEDDFNAAMETVRRFAESGCVVTITPLKVQA